MTIGPEHPPPAAEGTDGDPTRVQVLDRNLAVLEQAVAAVKALAHRYGESPAPGQSPVGAHVRHIIDHYESLLSGLESGRIDYYARSRDRALEADPEAAMAALGRIRARIAASADRLDRDVLVDTEGPADGSGDHRWAPSSVRREMAFVLSHTLHHLATIRGLGQRLGVDLDENLGVAHSTLLHRGRRGASSSA